MDALPAWVTSFEYSVFIASAAPGPDLGRGLFYKLPDRANTEIPRKYTTMNATPIRTLLGIALLTSLFSGDATGQTVKVGGLAYVDYFYRLGDDDDDSFWQRPQDNLWNGGKRDDTINNAHQGFTYRRMYLTTDATISENFKARFRLEANDKHAGSKGPIPFVKDMWVDWNYTGNHSARVGVMPPPVFQLSEHVWGFRSLEKTILDVQGVNSSRDFGIRFDGPIPIRNGLARYAVMLANGDPPLYSNLSALGGRSEILVEHDKNKTGYAQISIHPSDKMVFSVGAEYGKHSYPSDLREPLFAYRPYRDFRASVFGGYGGGVTRFGVEAFLHESRWEGTTVLFYAKLSSEEEGDTDTRYTRQFGISVFGSIKVNSLVEFVGRLDLTENNGNFSLSDSVLYETFVLAGVAFTPNEHVRIIPNLWWFGSNFRFEWYDYRDDGTYDGLALDQKRKNRMGRVTIEVSF